MKNRRTTIYVSQEVDVEIEVGIDEVMSFIDSANEDELSKIRREVNGAHSGIDGSLRSVQMQEILFRLPKITTVAELEEIFRDRLAEKTDYPIAV